MIKMVLIGNLGTDPQLRDVGGRQVASFNVGCRSRRKIKGGEGYETEWVRVTAWGTQADYCAKYLTKGTKIYASGDYSHGEYTNKDGAKVTTQELTLNTIEILSSKTERAAAKPEQNNGGFTEVEEDDELPF